MRNLLNSYIGDYHLTDFLGAGGMGEVYRAVHRKIGRVAAIKILTCFDPNSKFSERFINEARIQASLHHPNIATLYDFVEFEGRPCIIMEYVDGQTLYERIKAYGSLPLSEVIFIFQAVVEAIAYIHEQGIVHRDIKSNNIKISSSGHVKLLDFGIAKDTITPKLTLAGHYVGTLYYLSPEQIMGEKADTRSDIWSLGILLYEMVTGKLPFESESISDFYQKISIVDYIPVSAINPSVPEEIEEIIMRCLKQKPFERFSSAKELLDELYKLSNLTSRPRLRTFKKNRFQFCPAGIPSLFKDNWPLIATAFIILSVITVGVYFVNSSSDNGSIFLKKPLNPDNPSPSKPISSDAPLTQIKIDTHDGRADVYENNKYVGQTPYIQRYPIGSEVRIVLRRKGYQDKVVQFEVGEISNQYSYSLTKKRNQ